MRTLNRVLLLIVFLIASVVPARALEMEYYTYNGFGPVVSAFSKTALIFSDASYRGLFFTVVVMGILFGAAAVYFSTRGGRPSPLSWTVPVLFGVVFYLSLILPTGSLHIYDPVKNQYQEVAGIPDGIVLITGTLNKIQRGLIDIVSTAGDPVGYQAQAGGVGFDMLLNVHSKGVLLADHYIHRSLKKYIEDCIFFELMRPGTTLTVNQFANNADFIPLFEAAGSPAIFTVFYEDAVPEGVTLTCKDAIDRIKTKITSPAQFENTTKARCAEAGFDPTVPVEYTTCKSMLSNLVSWFEGASFDITQIYRQKFIAEEINNVVLSSSPDTAIQLLGSRNTGTSMLSAGMIANEWIPIIRAVTTAIAIGIIPILVIFIPTPIFLRALALIVGFFIWLAAWGVTDAIAHQFAIDYASTVFEEVRQYQLGLTAISSFGTASLKTLAAFGAIRWSGLMLATVITTTLIRFGGHALSTLAGQLTATPKQKGESIGELAKPEGAATALRSLEEAPPVMANAHKFNFNQRTGSKTGRLAKGVGEGLGYGGPEEAFATGQTEGQFARGAAVGKERFAQEVASGNVPVAGEKSAYFYEGARFGRGAGSFQLGKEIFGIDTPSQAASFEATGKMITSEMAAYAEKQGFRGVVSGMHMTHAGFNPKTGEASSMSFSGPVTSDNLNDLKGLAERNGHDAASQLLQPGMIATFTLNPRTGKGTFHATDNTAVQSEDFGEATINDAKGLTVDTAQGSFQLKSGKVQQVGGQVYINGSTEDGKKIQLEGSLSDGYTVIPGLKRNKDGTVQMSAEPGAALYEFQSKGTRTKEDGTLKTGVVKDRDGDISHIALNLTRAETQQGIRGHETLDSDGLKKLAKVVRSEGGPKNVASTLEHLASEGRSADVTFSRPAGAEGGLGTLSVKAGGTAATQDFSLSQNGWETISKAHSSSLRGRKDVSEDVSKRSVDHGISIGSAMQMALNRDPAIASFVSDPDIAKNQPDTFNANVATTASNLASDLGGFITKKGADLGHLRAELGAHFSLGGGASAGRSLQDNEVIDLLTGEYDRLIRSSFQEANDQGLNRIATGTYISGKIGDFTQEIYDKARMRTSKDFGADAGIGGIKSMFNDLSEKSDTK